MRPTVSQLCPPVKSLHQPSGARRDRGHRISEGQKIEIWPDKGRGFVGRAARAVEKAPTVSLSEDNFQTA